jgi:hypothetical protein
MYHNKMKVIGAIALVLSFATGFLALSATNVVFAADQSSKPSLQTPQIADRAPGYCNWDNDQDKDDWCWATTATTTTASITVPYGTIIGQADPYQDAYGYNGGYSNNNMYNYNGRFYFYRPGRLGRLFRRNGMPVILNGRLIYNNKWWWWMQP